METDSRLEEFQSVCSKGTLQDGDGRDDQRKSEGRRVGHVPRLYVCLPSCSGAPRIKKVSAIRCVRPSVSIQGPSHGSHNFGQDLHQGHQGGEGGGSTVRSEATPVFGRLAGPSSKSRTGCSPYSAYQKSGRDAGVSGKCSEIRAGTESANYFPGVPVQARRGSGVTHGGTMAENPESGPAVFGPSRDVGLALAVPLGTARFDREAGPSWVVEDETVTDSSGPAVVSSVAATRGKSPGDSGCCSSVALVDRQEERDGGGSHQRYRDKVSGVQRCLHPGLGGASGGDGGPWEMDRGGTRVPCKYVRDVECTSSSFSLQGNPERQHSDVGYRQHYGSLIHQEAGGNQVGFSPAGYRESLRFSGRVPDLSSMSAYSRETERLSRQSISTGTSDSHRVVHRPADFAEVMADVGPSHGGHVCDQAQPSASVVRVSDSGRSGLGGGRSQFGLGGHVDLCLSANGDSSEGAEQDLHVQLVGGLDSAGLAKTDLVSAAPGSPGRLPGPTAGHQDSSQAAAVLDIPQEPAGVQSTRVEIIEQSYVEKGFSQEAAGRMAKPQKGSTLAVYEGKWRVFVSWCGERGTSPCSASPPVIADFLCHLHDVKKLASSTIEGYRTAICQVLKATTGQDLGRNAELSSLLAYFDRQPQKGKASVPPWDLALVLQMLSCSPFEPMNLAQMKYVTFKTVFLLALASGRRRSELHALKSDILRTENWDEISILSLPTFVAKTRLAGQASAEMEPLTLKALGTHLADDLSEDKSLCVVRAIRCYLKRTKKIRGERDRLFIAFKPGFQGDISANTISGWIRKTICLAYEHSTPEIQQVHRIRAHDVRGMAASWALVKNASIDSILSACSWRSHTTFTSFYLKDLSRIQGDMLKLGPVVAALHRC